MQRIAGFARIPATGAPAPGATVTVYNTGTLQIPTIYADNIGTPKANPFVADSIGYFFFYANPNNIGNPFTGFDILFSGGGIPAGSEYTLADVPAGLGDGVIFSGDELGLSASAGNRTMGRLAYAFPMGEFSASRYGLLIDQGTAYSGISGWHSILDFPLTVSTAADLPLGVAAPGLFRLVSDSNRGLWIADYETGTSNFAWRPALAYAFPSTTIGLLPSPSLAGRLRRLTDDVRGLWMDAGTGWAGLSGEVANVVEFGAKRDGITDDAPAIQAAIDALQLRQVSIIGGTVVVPPGSYVIGTALKLRDGVTLRGMGGVVIGGIAAGWTADSMIRTYRRDDNDPTAEDHIGIENLTLSTPNGIALSAIDLTGATNSFVRNVRLIDPGVHYATALRLADHNPTSSSNKRCQNNILSNIYAKDFLRFLKTAQGITERGDRNLILNFEAENVRYGVDLTDIAAGTARLVLILGRLGGDSNVASQAIVRGATPLAGQVTLIQVDSSGFLVTTDWAGETFLNSNLAVGASGTSATAPVSQGDTLSQNFVGSVYLRLTSGTQLLAGPNVYTYTLPGILPGAAFLAAPVSGVPSTPITIQCALVDTILTVTVVAASSVVLSSDFTFRVVQIAP